MTVDTLPAWLNFQAGQRRQQIAIRHKQLGIWQEKSWAELHQEIASLVAALQIRGFGRGDTLYLLSEPRQEALLLALAAQWLGGYAALLDISETADTLTILQQLQAQFVFAEAQAQVDLVQSLNLGQRLLIYANRRGLSAYGHGVLQRYAELTAAGQGSINLHPLAEPDQPAFRFFRLNLQRQIEQQVLTHSELLAQGRKLIAQEALTDQEEALAARAFAASGHTRYLLAPWLLAGFKLNFPENLNTRDIDRRELGPTLVAGTRLSYQRLAELVNQRLPLPGTPGRAVVDWALAGSEQSSGLRLWLSQILIIRPLRDVLGLSRARVPLIVGERLTPQAAQLLTAIGVQVKPWPDLKNWQTAGPEKLANPVFETAAALEVKS